MPPSDPVPGHLNSVPPLASDAPTIEVGDRQEGDILQEGRERFRELAKINGIFRHGDELVMLQIEGADARLIPLSVDHVRGILARGVRWVKVDRRGNQMTARPPVPLCNDLRAFLDPGIAEAIGIRTIPSFVENGRLLAQSGYDKSTKLLVHLPDSFRSSIPSDPSDEDIDDGLSLLLDDWLVDFPWESRCDRANALATVITPFVWDLFSGTAPLIAIMADQVGTGKTLLAEAKSRLILGRQGSVMSFPTSETETGKLLLSLLREGAQIAVFDNAARMVNDSCLAALLTSSMYRDRVLQTSTAPTLPNRTLWMITGNQLQFGADITRRTVPIYLAPRAASPASDYTYKHPELLQWTAKSRSALIRAILVLVQAYLRRGAPSASRSMPSYVGWARTVGGILESVGVKGFLENRDRLQAESDLHRQATDDFFRCWKERLGGEPRHTSELVTIAEEVELPILEGKHTPRQRSTALGTYLQRCTKHAGLVPTPWCVSQVRDSSQNRNQYVLRADSDRESDARRNLD